MMTGLMKVSSQGMLQTTRDTDAIIRGCMVDCIDVKFYEGIPAREVYNNESSTEDRAKVADEQVQESENEDSESDEDPIVFEIHNLSQSERLYSIYDKEMLAIMHALTKFRQYLVGNKFVVNIDHSSLKYFLEKKDLGECQQKWVTKVQAFEFDIDNFKGKKNIMADALSRRPTTCSLMEISTDWKSHLLVEYSKNKFAGEVMDGQIQDDRYRVIDDVIFYKDRVYLVPNSGLKKKILTVVHDSPLAGHLGFFKTYRQTRERFSWKEIGRAHV